MQKLNDNDIIFITNHRYTPWLEWSRKSIFKFFPNCQYLQIDGTTNWPRVWFEWIERIKNTTAKYAILIDEDCFILNRDGVLDAIEKMVNENATIAGVPDAFFEMRGFSEIAINPFFMICDIQKVLQVVNSFPNGFYHLRFQDHYYNTAKYSWPVKTRQANPSHANYEPFYCFFWAVLETGNNISYLYPRVNSDFRNQHNQLPATSVRVTSDTPDIALHMWYSRQWNDHQNAFRYEKLLQFLTNFLS